MIIINKYATMTEANHKIRGGIVGGVPCNVPYGGLVGKTLTFSNPVGGSCTFNPQSGRGYGQLNFADVKSQLETQVPDIEVITIDNKFALRRKTVGQVVALPAIVDPANYEVARAILGFSPGELISGQYLNGPSGANPKYLEFVTECGNVYISIEVD